MMEEKHKKLKQLLDAEDIIHVKYMKESDIK